MEKTIIFKYSLLLPFIFISSNKSLSQDTTSISVSQKDSTLIVAMPIDTAASDVSANTLTFQQELDNLSYKNMQVIEQMNYCISSLTNIKNNKSFEVLEYELDQLLNNLTMEHIISLPEVASFRIELLDKISNLQITDEERAVLRRVQSIKRDNLKWQSLSNALNPTMLLFPQGGIGGAGLQMGFQALLTVARTAVQFKTGQGELEIEELLAMWELKKSDLENIKDLTKEAHDLVFKLYKRFNLSEYDRLTEETALKFNEIISEPDPNIRINLLLDNKALYRNITDYYYYLGMSYLDINQYKSAKPYLDTYVKKYKSTPIFRYNEKLGCVDLAFLTYENLDTVQTRALLSEVEHHLQNNGAAMLQCALIYYHKLNDVTKAFETIRAAIDNPKLTDKDLILDVTIELLPQIRNYPAIYQQIKTSINNRDNFNLNSYVTYLLEKNDDNIWTELETIIQVPGKKINKKEIVNVSSKFRFSLSDFKVYYERFKGDKLIIKELFPEYKYGVSKQKMCKKVKCFEAYNSLIYLFFDTVVEGELYRQKSNLDYKKILAREMRGMENFVLTNSDPKKIVRFLKKHQNKDGEYIALKCTKSPKSGEKHKIDSIVPYIDNSVITDVCSAYNKDSLSNNLDLVYKCKYKGQSDFKIRYYPYNHNKEYLRLCLNSENPINLVYSYSKDSAMEGIYLYAIEVDGNVYFREEINVQKTNPKFEESNNTATDDMSFWQKIKKFISSILMWEINFIKSIF